MKLLDFMAKLHEEIQKMVFPRCTMLEQIGAGIVLGAVDFRVGQLVSENSELVKKLGLIDEAGEVNIDCVEHAIINGVQWPQKIGPFKFDKADAEKILTAVKAQDQALKGQSK